MDPQPDKDLLEKLMLEALREAARAEELGEVPVGAVVFLDGEILGRGCNRPVSAGDPTAHAEIEALREAARARRNYRLGGAVLVSTLEPCPMCAGACLQARIGTLAFGARDPKTGAVRSLYRLLDDPRHNHRIEIVEGILAEECSRRLQDFFKARRG